MNIERMNRIERALEGTAGEDVRCDISYLADVWGTTKTRFIPIRNMMASFPVEEPNGYPQKHALRVMQMEARDYVDASTVSAEAARIEALETALIAREGEVERLKNEVDNTLLTVADLRSNAEAMKTAMNQGRELLGDMKDEAKFQRDRADELQRKLDRTMGYLDAKLDQEESYDKPVMREGEKPSVGPDLSGIDPARRPVRSMGDTNYAGGVPLDLMRPATGVRYESPTSRPRRY